MASFSPGPGRQTVTPAGAAASLPAPGVVLFGRYRLDEILGQGGMAEVWRAHDEELDRAVAIRILHRQLLPDERSRERFAAEARAVSGLSHPGIVTVHDVVVDGEQAAIVVELVDGEALSDVLAQRGRLPELAAAAVTAQVAHGLQAAHDRGLVHRDVSPANVLLSADGRVRISDFGIARALDDRASSLALPGTIMGTLRYMAPEQLADGTADRATDVFGLGSLLYEMLVGRPPFPGATPAALMAQQRQGAPQIHGASPELAGLARTALQHDAERRPRSAGSMAAMLERWLDNSGAFSADLPGITSAALSGGPMPRPAPASRPSPAFRQLPDGTGVPSVLAAPSTAATLTPAAGPGPAAAAAGPTAATTAAMHRSRRPIRAKHRAADGTQQLFPSAAEARTEGFPAPAGWTEVASPAPGVPAGTPAPAGARSPGPEAAVDPAAVAVGRSRGVTPFGLGRRRVPLVSAVGLAGLLLAGLLLAGALAALQAGSAPARPGALPTPAASAPTGTPGVPGASSPVPAPTPAAVASPIPASTPRAGAGQSPAASVPGRPKDTKRRRNE